MHIMDLENKVKNLEKQLHSKETNVEKKKKKRKYPNPFVLHFMMETFMKEEQYK